ncbi:MAG: hypothetical protein ABIQ11_07860 [Saprospiraceae bacterium]
MKFPYMSYRSGIKWFFLIACFVLFHISTNAQINPGIKFGVSTPNVNPKDFVVRDSQGVDYYHIFVDKAYYGIHGGAFVQIQIGGFFIQPEVLYNSTRVSYRIDSLSTTRVFTDSYKNIDFPLIFGLKSGAVRLGGGPVGHLFFDSASGFNDYPGFDAVVQDLTWGWQACLGLDFWKLHIDLRYEGNFSKLGDHISFFGEEYDFATDNNRIIASLGFSF